MTIRHERPIDWRRCKSTATKVLRLCCRSRLSARCSASNAGTASAAIMCPIEECRSLTTPSAASTLIVPSVRSRSLIGRHMPEPIPRPSNVAASAKLSFTSWALEMKKNLPAVDDGLAPSITTRRFAAAQRILVHLICVEALRLLCIRMVEKRREHAMADQDSPPTRQGHEAIGRTT